MVGSSSSWAPFVSFVGFYNASTFKQSCLLQIHILSLGEVADAQWDTCQFSWRCIKFQSIAFASV